MSAKQKSRTLFEGRIVKNLLMIIVVAFAILFLTLVFLRFYTRHDSDVVVPSLQGLQVNEAGTILESKGLRIEVVDSIYRRDAVPGAILSQKPKSGNKVKKGRAIYAIIYAKNPQQVAVPGVADYSLRQAIALLNSIGFTQLDIETAPSEYAGLVLAVKYRGKTLLPDEKIPAGSPLSLIVGSGLRSDSLNVDSDYIVAPANENPASAGTPHNQPAKQEHIDESFF